MDVLTTASYYKHWIYLPGWLDPNYYPLSLLDCFSDELRIVLFDHQFITHCNREQRQHTHRVLMQRLSVLLTSYNIRRLTDLHNLSGMCAGIPPPSICRLISFLSPISFCSFFNAMRWHCISESFMLLPSVHPIEYSVTDYNYYLILHFVFWYFR